MKVTMEHVRSVPAFTHRAGLCANGGRAWCARHGLNWRDFLRGGIEVERLRVIGDAFALALIAHAERGARHG